MSAVIDPTRSMHLELRTGDVLQLPGGVTMQLQYKKGQAARFEVRTPAGVDVKKVVGAPKRDPSRPL